MKALLITDNFPPRTGGSGRWFYELYRRLECGEVAIAAGQHPNQEAFDDESGLTIHRVPLSLGEWGLRSAAALKGYWRAYQAMRRLVAEQRPEQIHCGRNLPEGWLGWLLRKRFGIPYLVYVHGEDLAAAATSRELAWMTSRVLHGASRVIANSRNTRQLVVREWGISPHRVALLHPGVDVERFHPAPISAAARARFGWQDRTVILTVSRLQKRKGHDQLIRALAAIRCEIPEVLYAVVGDGEERARLERLVAEMGLQDHVRFHGEVAEPELAACYQQCDLFVLPNRDVAGDFEGFGMVLVEAQACGKPVIAGRSGGTGDTLRCWDTGVLVDCSQPEPLADAVLELLRDPIRRERMGAASRTWVEQQFAWDRLAEQAEEIFGFASNLHAKELAIAVAGD